MIRSKAVLWYMFGLLTACAAFAGFWLLMYSIARPDAAIPAAVVTRSVPVEVNGMPYAGSPTLYNEETQDVYISLEELASSMGVPYLPADGQSALWNQQQEVSPDGSRVLSSGGQLYASDSYLRDVLGLNVFRNGDVCYIDNYPSLDYGWTRYRTVFHACGGIDGYSYTNSYEALDWNYGNGARLFEIDFCMSADGVPICAHDWNWTYSIMDIPLLEDPSGETDGLAAPLTLGEWKARRIYGRYTPMSFEELLAFMREHGDMYVITDTKDVKDPEISQMFRAMVEVAGRHDPGLLDRIIPQIYNNDMYDIISGIYPWKSVVYTLYNQGNAFRYGNVYDYAWTHGIRVFTTYFHRDDPMFIRQVTDRGGKIYMNSYNDMEEVRSLVENLGIYGIYTDFLPPDCLET